MKIYIIIYKKKGGKGVRLGDYVHSTYRLNYLKYGLHHQTQESYRANSAAILKEAQTAIAKEHEAIKKEANAKKSGNVNSEDLKQVSSIMDFMFNGTNASANAKQLYDSMENSWKEYIDKALDQWVKQYYTGLSFHNGILHSDGVDQALIDELNKIIAGDKASDDASAIAKRQAMSIIKGSKVGTGKTIKGSTIENKLKGFEYLITKAEGMFDEKEIASLKQNLNTILEYKNKILNENKSEDLPASIPIVEDDKDLQKVIAAINYQEGISRFPKGNEIGEIFEVFGTIYSGLVTGAITGNMDNLTKEFLEGLQFKGIDLWTGNKTEEVKMDQLQNLVGGSKYKNQQRLVNQLNNGNDTNFKWEFRPGQGVSFSQGTQSKVDLNLFYDASKEPLAISAKNYSLKSSSQQISLVSSTNFLLFLQSLQLNRYEAYNHWLNLGVIEQAGMGYDSSTTFQNAIAMVKSMIISKALTGNLPGRASAEYLLVNARNGTLKGMHLIPMSNMVAILQQNLDDYTISGIADIENPPKGHKGYPYNDWKGDGQPDVDKAYARITRMIYNFARYKITVHMKQKALRHF